MIHTAVEKGHEADINAKNKAGQTPLSIAATSGRLGVVSILLEAEAPVDVADEENDPAVARCELEPHRSRAYAS